MRMIIVKNGMRMLKKHPIQSLIMLVLTFVCLYMVGVAIDASNKSKAAEIKYEETYGHKTLYYTSEALSDQIFYSYCEEKGRESYDRLHKYLMNLYQTTKFSFATVSKQYVQVTSFEVPDLYLDGYETGNIEQSVVNYEGEKNYIVKSIQVSPNFFDVFSVAVSEGRMFTEADYLLEDDTVIPVLLGNAYRDYLDLDDTFEGYYLGNKFRYKVIGFVDESSFYFDRSSNNMTSCERYMILPALYSDKADWFARIMLLDHFNGFVSSSIGYEKTKEIFDEMRKTEGIGTWNIFCLYEGVFKTNNVLDMYSAMTKEVSRQFFLIVILIVIFSSAVNMMVLCGMLRENFQTFGVERLCGASLKDIIAEASVAIEAIMGISDLAACAGLIWFGYGFYPILLIQVIVLGISLFTCIICGRYVKRMELNTFIGGKE